MDFINVEYPEHIWNIKEIQRLANVIDIEMAKLGTEIDNLKADMYVETSTERGIARREKVLGIEPFDTDTLEDRREAVSAVYNDTGTYTAVYLRRQLNRIIGQGNYTLDVDYTNKLLTLRINLAKKALLKTVTKLCERIVPLNIILDIDLIYNRWDDLTGYTWNDLSADDWDHWESDVL